MIWIFAYSVKAILKSGMVSTIMDECGSTVKDSLSVLKVGCVTVLFSSVCVPACVSGCDSV